MVAGVVLSGDKSGDISWDTLAYRLCKTDFIEEIKEILKLNI